MRVTTSFITLATLFFVSVSSAPAPEPEPQGGRGGGDRGRGGWDDDNSRNLRGGDFSERTQWNAPIAPWRPNAQPGWYLGDHPERHPRVFCLVETTCSYLERLPRRFRCPKRRRPRPTHTHTNTGSTETPTSTNTEPEPTETPPADGYTLTFQNLTGATQANGYMTYGLVDTIDDCKAMCNNVEGCKFANTYNDVNGKDGSTQLTCSLFNACQGPETATNTGGQTQPNGSINYITNSDGHCKA